MIFKVLIFSQLQINFNLFYLLITIHNFYSIHFLQYLQTRNKQTNKTMKTTQNKTAKKVETAKVVTPKKVKEAPKVTFKEQIEGNAKMKLAMQTECKKLGFALSLLEKHIDCFAPLVQSYIAQIRSEQILYKLAETNCPKSKAGNFTPWLLQSYIRKAINSAK